MQSNQCQPYAKWSEHGQSFAIVNVSAFTQNVLPQFFKHNNYSSFVRQLNLYGFSKVKGTEGEHVYEHQNFKRGSKGSIKKIQRVALNEKKEIEKQIQHENRICILDKKNQIQRVLEKQNFLENKYLQLIERNRVLLLQNETILNAIRNQQRKRQKIMSEIIMIMQSIKAEQLQNGPTVNAIQNDKTKLNEQKQDEGSEKIKNMFDPNQDFLTLDDFLNIDNDSVSEFRLD